MNLLLVIVSLLVILIVAVTFVVAMSNNTAVGRRVRIKLIERLRQAPLYRMLKVRHIDVTRYEAEMPQQSIKDQLQFCDTCTHQQQCEKMLHNPSSAADDYDFCPNAKAIKKLAERERG